ncbi:MAG: response regulator [Candidatus Riflebacteria bacterium]|nr:response regulator [Candidatus Riflebacteria bacterium]
MADGRIRVLVADDSPTIVAFMEDALGADPAIEVVGIARNGREAVDMAASLKPDIITMDIVMPRMDGLAATQLIMGQTPTPIIVISSCIDPEEQTITLNALNAGAVAALAKPTEIFGTDGDAFRNVLLTHVRQFCRVKVRSQPVASGTPALKLPGPAPALAAPRAKSPYQVIAVGASVGGPTALFNFVAHFPPSFALPIVVVQHIAPGLLPTLTAWLHESTGRLVEIAQEGEAVVGRSILFAPDGTHLTLTENLKVHLTDDPPVGDKKPSIDVLFRSLATSLGPKAVGVLLSVVGGDGPGGLGALKAAGAKTFAQDESSSVIVGTGPARPELAIADYVLPPGQIARQIGQLVRGEEAVASPIPGPVSPIR